MTGTSGMMNFACGLLLLVSHLVTIIMVSNAKLWQNGSENVLTSVSLRHHFHGKMMSLCCQSL
jgi:hypothetical protein